MNAEHPDLEEALQYIDPTSLSYNEWFSIGAALHNEGYDFEVWDRWLAASGSEKYHGPGSLVSHWRSFHEGGGYTGATVAKIARDNGWNPPPHGTFEPGERHIKARRIHVDPSPRLVENVLTKVDPEAVYAPPDPSLREYTSLCDVDQIRRYVEAIFLPGEIVAWVSKATPDGGKPATKGIWMERDDWLKKLAKSGRTAIYDDYGWTGDPDDPNMSRQQGAWIRFNPVDGEGVKNENITAWRCSLVEADSGEPEQQRAIMEAMHLPILALTYSGAKSMHAIVAVDAKNAEEYAERVNLLYAECQAAGLAVDTQNKNAARLSRLPGVPRNGVMQKLVYTWRDLGIDRPTWNGWREELAEQNDPMPKTVSLRDLIMRTDCVQAPQLIEGVLRFGHKMMLAAPSKAGKSFALMELCALIADGPDDATWLGWRIPSRGRVLYINLELDEPDCRQRFIDIYQALGISTETMGDNLQILNLRGHGAPLDKLVPFITRRCEEIAPVLAIVIDPFYKVTTGDENNAADMAIFCNAVDQIANSCKIQDVWPYGPSVIYSHHFIKTGLKGREAMARASGSGVFVRDGDALITMTPIESNAEGYVAACARGRDGKAIEHQRYGFTVDGSLRSFPTFEPFHVWFEHPIHYCDAEGEIAKALRKKKPAEQKDPKDTDDPDEPADPDDLEWGDMTREQQHAAFNRACQDFRDDPDAVSCIAARFGMSKEWAKKRLQRNKAWDTDGMGGIVAREPMQQNPS